MVPNRTGLIAVRIVGLAAQVRRRLDPIWPAWRYRLFAVAWLAAFLLTCNVYLLATVMPAAVRSLSSKVGAVETALVLSPLVTAALLPASRRLELLRGRRRVMSWSLVVYGGGLIVAAARVSATMLILGFAAICGLAGAPPLAGPWAAVAPGFGPPRPPVDVLHRCPAAGSERSSPQGALISRQQACCVAQRAVRQTAIHRRAPREPGRRHRDGGNPLPPAALLPVGPGPGQTPSRIGRRAVRPWRHHRQRGGAPAAPRRPPRPPAPAALIPVTPPRHPSP